MIDEITNYGTWLNQINWIVSIILALIISIVANIMTPSVQNWRARRSTILSEKRIKDLELEYKHTKILYDDKDQLYLVSMVVGFRILIYFGVGGFTSLIFGNIFYLFGVLEAWRHIKLLKRVKEFDLYEKEVIEIMNSLKSKSTESS